jgi:SagB-type dehydrogenase family enzyme
MKVEINRAVLRADDWIPWQDSETDQKSGLPIPPLQKPVSESTALIDLKPAAELPFGKNVSLFDAINNRKSRRKYAQQPLSLDELSFLLWATQGLQEWTRGNTFTRRTVPSGGSRQPFETYLYRPLSHQLLFLYSEEGLAGKVNEAYFGQYIKTCAAAFMWTAFPYRSEWRYTYLAPKIILQDSGHLCQNLYLACEAIGAGTCAIGAYDQAKMDALLQVDGVEEFAVYAATLGKV